MKKKRKKKKSDVWMYGSMEAWKRIRPHIHTSILFSTTLRVKTIARLFASILVWLYTIALVAWLVLRAQMGDAVWWLAFPNTFAPYVFGGLVPAALIVWLIPSRTNVSAWAVAFALFVIWFAPEFFPTPPPVAATSNPHIKIMTLNLYEESIRVEPMLERIRAENPDVVVMQELNPLNATALPEFHAQFPYHALMPLDGQDAGMGIISKIPFQEHGWFPLGGQPHDALRVTLDVDGRAVELLNVHLANNWITLYLEKSRNFFDEQNRIREQQANEIIAFTRAHPTTIVAGDFNLTETTTAYSILQNNLRDSFRARGWGLGGTFSSEWFWYGRIPVPPRVLRLDYVMHTRAFITTDAYIGERDSQSDHLPVIATLEFAK